LGVALRVASNSLIQHRIRQKDLGGKSRGISARHVPYRVTKAHESGSERGKNYRSCANRERASARSLKVVGLIVHYYEIGSGEILTNLRVWDKARNEGHELPNLVRFNEIFQGFQVGAALRRVLSALANNESTSWNTSNSEVRYRVNNGFHSLVRLNESEACEDWSLLTHLETSAQCGLGLFLKIVTNLYAVRNNDHTFRPSAISDSFQSTFWRMNEYSVNHTHERLILGGYRIKLMHMGDNFYALRLKTLEHLREYGLNKESTLTIYMENIDAGGLYRGLKLRVIACRWARCYTLPTTSH
jgi:hypothetical protein